MNSLVGASFLAIIVGLLGWFGLVLLGCVEERGLVIGGDEVRFTFQSTAYIAVRGAVSLAETYR